MGRQFRVKMSNVALLSAPSPCSPPWSSEPFPPLPPFSFQCHSAWPVSYYRHQCLSPCQAPHATRGPWRAGAGVWHTAGMPSVTVSCPWPVPVLSELSWKAEHAQCQGSKGQGALGVREEEVTASVGLLVTMGTWTSCCPPQQLLSPPSPGAQQVSTTGCVWAVLFLKNMKVIGWLIQNLFTLDYLFPVW